MRDTSTRAVKAAMAAAFGAAFIGSALAASPIGGIANPTGGDSPSAASTPSAPDTSSTGGLTNNGLANVEVPKVSGVAFQMPAKHHDGDLDCKGLSGKSSLPGGNGSFQHKAQCKNNSVAHGKAEIAGIKL
jgi:hypothetical protein